MDSLPLVFSSGWASGVNAYLVVLVLGVADRVNPTESIPDALGAVPDVELTAAVDPKVRDVVTWGR